MKISRIILILFFTLVPFCTHAALVISPAKLEVMIDPGERQSLFVTVTNTSSQEVTVRASLQAITLTDTNVSIEESDLTKTRPIPPFVDIPEPITVISTHGEVRIPIVFTPHKDSPPGSSATVLLLTQEREPDTEAQARIVSRVAIPILITVIGDLHPSGVLSFFNTTNHRRISASQQVIFTLRYKNQGTVNLNPYGLLTVRSLFGTVRTQYRVDPWYVLSNAERSREFTLVLPRLPGLYQVTLELNRGYQDIVDTRSVWLLYLPLWVGILILLTLSGGVFAMIKHSRS